MKIGDECWIVQGIEGHHHEVVYSSLDEAQSWCDEDGDTTHRVRIVPADPWRTDLENAPKDDDVLISGLTSLNRRYVSQAIYCEDGKWRSPDAPNDEYFINVTHWQPLPPPPEEE